MKLTLQLVVVVLIAPTKFRDNLQLFLQIHSICNNNIQGALFNTTFSTKVELQRKINMPGS